MYFSVLGGICVGEGDGGEDDLGERRSLVDLELVRAVDEFRGVVVHVFH